MSRLEDRVEEFAIRVLRHLGEFTDERAIPEGWVGIELALGLAAALKAFCSECGYDLDRVLSHVGTPSLTYSGGSA